MTKPGAYNSCLRCGTCCRWAGHVLLTHADILQLALFLKSTVQDVVDRYTVLARNRAGLSLADRPDGACIFLRGNVCSVYHARPAQCREFNERWTVRGGCPGTQA